MNQAFLPLVSPFTLNPLQTSFPFGVQPYSQAALSLNIQVRLLNSQLAKLAEIRQLYTRQPEISKKFSQQPQFALGQFANLVHNPIPLQSSHPKGLLLTSANYPQPAKLNKANELPANLGKELEKMLKLLLVSVGKGDLTKVQEIKSLYAHNPILFEICEKLIIKYCGTRKCKEDITRYVLRKALKTIKSKLCKQEKVHGKKAVSLLCKRYFHSRFEAMEKAGLNCENEEELFEFILPYRKNSKNRTMNSHFIEEVFSCEEFCEEYQNFLKDFDCFLDEDNVKKTKKLIDFLVSVIKEGNIAKLDNFNRLPWLEVWLEDTKKVAVGLLANSSPNISPKKVKA